MVERKRQRFLNNMKRKRKRERMGRRHKKYRKAKVFYDKGVEGEGEKYAKTSVIGESRRAEAKENVG